MSRFSESRWGAPKKAWPGLLLDSVLALILALTLCKTLAFHRRLIRYPYPLDVAEPAQGLFAQGVAAGFSTGSLTLFPVVCDYYGPLGPLVTGELCRYGFACGLQSQRLLNALFLALILALFAAAVLRLGATRLCAAALSLWVYELLLIHFTPIARPDALGTLLWFAGLCLPFLAGYAFWSLAVAAMVFTLAGLTKLYFLCGALFLALGLLRRRRRVAFFAVAQAVCLAAAYLWIRTEHPYALCEAVLPQAGNLLFDRGHMLMQVWVVLFLASPGFVLMAFLSAREAWSDGTGAQWGLYGVLGLALFVLVLGGARGGLFTYLIQLSVLPFAVWFAVACRAGRPWGTALSVVLTLTALGAYRVAVHPGFNEGSPVLEHWQRADALVAKAHHPMVPSDLDLSVEARGLPVYDTGLSDCGWLSPAWAPAWEARLFPETGLLRARYRAWQERSRRALLDPHTDLVVVSDFSAYGTHPFVDILRARYRSLGRLQIAYPQCGWAVYWLTFYVPKGASRPPT